MSQELSSMAGGFNFGKKSGGNASAAPKSESPSDPPKDEKKKAAPPKKAAPEKSETCSCDSGPKHKIDFEMGGKKFGGFVVERDGGKLDAVLTCDEDFAVVKGCTKKTLAKDLKKAASQLAAIDEDFLGSPEDAKKAENPDGTQNDKVLTGKEKKKKKPEDDGLDNGKQDLMDKKVKEGAEDPLAALGWNFNGLDEWIAPKGSKFAGYKIKYIGGSYTAVKPNGDTAGGPQETNDILQMFAESSHPRDHMKKLIAAVQDVRGTPRVRF